MPSQEELLTDLNEAQRQAVEYCDGASLVIAGAGSGKTRVLTYKIAYLLSKGLAPWNILALTFTNKAANEMKERIDRLLGGQQSRSLWMGTFHSIFLRILRTEHEAIGFVSNFTIYDDADQRSLIKNIVKEMGLDDKVYKPSSISARIGKAKNRLINAEAYAADSRFVVADTQSKMPNFSQIYRAYEQRCKQANAMDFDDILFYTYVLFRDHDDIRKQYASKFEFVLVDEYQDTNYAQHQIIWQLTKERQRLCVVGDDAQSIYSFRGANIDNILSFQQMYAGCKLFKLEQNYRSTQTIVAAANSLIKANTHQIEKNVFSRQDVGERIVLTQSHSDVEEAKIVARTIKRLRRNEHADFADFAVLYRTNAQSRVLEDEFAREGFAYHIYGGQSFYQRKEVKDVLAYFRLVVNMDDEEAFRRIINYPARGIGQTTVGKLLTTAHEAHVSVWSVLQKPNDFALKVNKGTLAHLEDFCQMIETLHAQAEHLQADEIGMEVLRQSGLYAEIFRDDSLEGRERKENLEELQAAITDFCQSRREEGDNRIRLTDYLAEVSLLSDLDSDANSKDNTDRISMMTVHAAKGLEFKNVFVVGMEENLFPSLLSEGSAREVEEERRLFYVAITRAEHRCFLSYAGQRFRFGKMETGIRPSRFLNDIDARFLDIQSTAFQSNHDASAVVELPWARSRREPTDSQTTRPLPWETGSQPTIRPRQVVAPEPQPSSIRRSTLPPVPVENLQVGSRIEHERFGFGTVTQIEGQLDQAKISVTFDVVGSKQLLLKYARFKVLS